MNHTDKQETTLRLWLFVFYIALDVATLSFAKCSNKVNQPKSSAYYDNN